MKAIIKGWGKGGLHITFSKKLCKEGDTVYFLSKQEYDKLVLLKEVKDVIKDELDSRAGGY